MSVGLLQIEEERAGASVGYPLVKQLLLALLCILWFVPGVTGRGLWKPVETSMVPAASESMVEGWTWVPTLLGAPYLEAPPLFLAVAAGAGLLLSPLLELHEGMRWGNVLWLLLGFGIAGAAAAHHRGSRVGWRLVLLMAGSIGLLLHSKTVNPDLALLWVGAAGIVGMHLLRIRPLAGGLLLGAVGGLGFWSAGAVTLWFLVFLLALPAMLRLQGVQRRINFGTALAVTVASLLVGLWFLSMDAPVRGQAGQFLLARMFLSPLALFANAVDLLRAALWFTWPALPFAAMAYVVWRHGKPPIEEIPLGLLGLAAGSLAIVFTDGQRESAVILLLPPAAAMAASNMGALSREYAKMMDKFAIAVIGAGMIGFLWFVWLAAQLGWPPAVGEWLAAQGIDSPGGSYLSVAAALAFTATWFGLSWRIGRSSERAVLNWMSGATITWIVFALLWMASVDRVKSYEDMALSLADHLSADRQSCVAVEGASLDLVAQMSYLGGLDFELGAAGKRCPLVLTTASVAADGSLEWTGRRPGDHPRGALRLYRRP